MFYSRGSSHPCIIESSSVCPAAWYLTLHVFDSIILARVDTSRLLFFFPRFTPPLSRRLSCVPLWGAASFPAKLFPEAERGTFRFCQGALSSWRRSSRGNSQMMTAIVKGQISPCGFASDCMFISSWSGRDSKPLSRSPHSPYSWSSACHWNRLRADPGDRGKVAVCHPTSVLARKISFTVLFFFFVFTMSLTDQLLFRVRSTCEQLIEVKTHTHKPHCWLIKKKKSIPKPYDSIWTTVCILKKCFFNLNEFFLNQVK